MIGRLILSSVWAFGAILWIMVFVDNRNTSPLMQYIPGECSAASNTMMADSGAGIGSNAAPGPDTGSNPAKKDTVSASTIAPTSSLSIQSCINVNTADQQALMKLPGIGTVLAERIIACRTQNKAFAKPQDLRQVKGIGEKKLAKIQNLICF